MSIIGECPHEDCRHTAWRILPEETPVFAKETCEGCKRTLWVWYSRLDPRVYTEDGFNADFYVDEETQAIRQKGEP